MYQIRTLAEKIDYNQAFTVLLPNALEMCRGIKNPNMLLRLFLQLDQDAAAVLNGLMEELSPWAKNGSNL